MLNNLVYNYCNYKIVYSILYINFTMYILIMLCTLILKRRVEAANREYQFLN